MIAFTRNGDIYVIDSTGGALRRLTSGKAADSDPSWSSDGARLVFVRDGAVVARAPEPGAAALFLARSSVAATDPAWSPDGRYVVFSSGGQVCAAQRDPSEQEGRPDPWLKQRLTPAGVSYSQPAWRPHPGIAESQAPVFGPVRLSSTLDCDADPYFTFGSTGIDPGKGHKQSLVVVTLGLTNLTRRTLEDVWLAAYRDGNRLVGLKTASGRCRRPPPLEWECAFGSLGPGETATVDVRYRGRYSASAGVFFYRDMPSFPGDHDLDLDYRSIEICDIVGTEGTTCCVGRAAPIGSAASAAMTL